MSAKPGSIPQIVRELLRLYGHLAVTLPLVAAAVVGIVTGFAAPSGLEDNSRHAEWKDLYATSGQIVATLLVALVVEARAPFARSGALVVRFAALSAGLLLGIAGMAAVAGLSPSLPGYVYPALLVLVAGGAAAGFTAVSVLGISIALGTLRRVDIEALEELKKLGDPAAAEELFRRREL